MNTTTKTVAGFVGYTRRHTREPWQAVANGPTWEAAWDALEDIQGERLDKLVLPAGRDPNREGRYGR